MLHLPLPAQALLLRRRQQLPAAGGVKDVNVPDIGGDEVEVTEVMVKWATKLPLNSH